MILISYDIQCDKLRNRFSKYLKKFGYRLQFSVFEITHSEHMLEKIKLSITNEFEKKFTQTDSVLIVNTSKSCKIDRFGYAKNDESDVLVVT